MIFDLKLLKLLILPAVLLMSGCETIKEYLSKGSEVPCDFKQQSETPYQISCYYISVPENYDVTNGRMLDLAVVRLSTKTSSTKKPPIFEIGAGGPGAPIGLQHMNIFASSYSWALNSGHEVIIFDVRGVGASKPSLTCDGFEYQSEFWNEYKEHLRGVNEINTGNRLIRNCMNQWLEKGINFSKYNSQTVAKDVESIRRFFGFKNIIPTGISYSAIYAYNYARNNKGKTEKLILISPVFPSEYKSPFFIVDGIWSSIENNDFTQKLKKNSSRKVSRKFTLNMKRMT